MLKFGQVASHSCEFRFEAAALNIVASCPIMLLGTDTLDLSIFQIPDKFNYLLYKWNQGMEPAMTILASTQGSEGSSKGAFNGDLSSIHIQPPNKLLLGELAHQSCLIFVDSQQGHMCINVLIYGSVHFVSSFVVVLVLSENLTEYRHVPEVPQIMTSSCGLLSP